MRQALHIAHLVDLLNWGGAQKLLVIFTETAVRRGLHPLIISLQPNNGNSPLPSQLAAIGADVILLSISSLSEHHALPTLTRLLRSKSVDILHTHLTHANILGPIAGRLAGIPVVSTLHNTKLRNDGHHRLRMAMESLILRTMPRRVIAVGQTVVEANQARLGKRKLDIILNAVPPAVNLNKDERASLRKEMMSEPDRILFLSIGRLTPQKAYPDLLTAFAKSRKHAPQACLAIIGEGDLRGELEQILREFGLERDVRLLGHRQDVPKLLAASDAYVSSSHWEGLSVAMLEAMAAGLPILATSVGDTSHLLADGRGLLVLPGDIPALTRGLIRVTNDPELRRQLGMAARTEAETRYAPDPWLDSLLQLYTEVREASQ
jgi:glycosyltransferase involved in cell wall biosynthesis